MTGPYPVDLVVTGHEVWNRQTNQDESFVRLSVRFRLRDHVILDEPCTAEEVLTSTGFDRATVRLMKKVFS